MIGVVEGVYWEVLMFLFIFVLRLWLVFIWVVRFNFFDLGNNFCIVFLLDWVLIIFEFFEIWLKIGLVVILVLWLINEIRLLNFMGLFCSFMMLLIIWCYFFFKLYGSLNISFWILFGWLNLDEYWLFFMVFL